MTERPPLVTRGWKRVAVIGNVTAGVVDLIGGRVDRLFSVTDGAVEAVIVDGVHNIGDAATYETQGENVLVHQHGEDEAHLLRRRRISHSIIASGSLAVGIVAAVEFATKTEHLLHNYSIAAAAASVAINTGLAVKPLKGAWQRRRGGIRLTDSEHDIVKHFTHVDLPSAALALTGALMHKYNLNISGHGAEHAAAMLSSGLGVWAFRPSTENLLHHSH